MLNHFLLLHLMYFCEKALESQLYMYTINII